MGTAVICLTLTSNGGYGYWHQAFDKILLGLGMNQLIAGIALTCASLLTYGWFPKDMHANFSYQLSCLAASSYIRDPNILLDPRSHRSALVLRKYCSYVYVALIVCFLPGIIRNEKNIAFNSISAMSVSLLVLPAYGEIAVDWFIDCNCQDKRRRDIVCLKLDEIRDNSWRYWCSALFASTWSSSYVISLKWKHANEFCDLNTAAEDKWTYGQILAVLMLMSCLGTAWDAFKGMLSAQSSALNSSADLNLQKRR